MEIIFLLALRLTEVHVGCMKTTPGIKQALALLVWIVVGFASPLSACAQAQPAEALPKAFIDGKGPGWRALGDEDFQNVNCATNTWTWTNGVIYCTGQPIGVIRS